MSQNEKDDVGYSLSAREILVALFATPAALSALKELNESLDLSEPIKRIVLGFDGVVEGAWLYLKELAGVDLGTLTMPVTALIMLTLPLVWERVGNAPPLSQAHGFVQVMSVLFAGYIFLMKGGHVFVAAIAFWAGLGFFLSGSLTAFRIMKVTLGRKSLKVLKHFPVPIVLFGVGFLLLLQGLSQTLGVVDYSLVGFLLFVFAGAITFFVLSHHLNTGSWALAYAGLIVVGILIVNWIETIALPNLNKFLTSVGA